VQDTGVSGDPFTGVYTYYALSESSFVLPTVVATSQTTEMSIWSGLDNVFQAVVWLTSTPTVANYSIQRQIFYCTNVGGTGCIVGQSETVANLPTGPLFAPNANDAMFTEQYYCDATGQQLSMSDLYACTYIADPKQRKVWDCTRSNDSICPSIPLLTSPEAQGLGTSAEFVLENDTGELGYDSQWPTFSPITMYGSAEVVQSQGASWPTVAVEYPWTDPHSTVLLDWTSINQSQVQITQVPSNAGGITWSLAPRPTNVYMLASSRPGTAAIQEKR
jgi:hypothetical protein